MGRFSEPRFRGLIVRVTQLVTAIGVLLVVNFFVPAVTLAQTPAPGLDRKESLAVLTKIASSFEVRLDDKAEPKKVESDGASFEVWRRQALTMNSLREAMKDKRLNTKLVFLSACESQSVNVSAIQFGGNTHKAIGTTFLILGAENAIATYWQVDASSAEQIALQTLSKLPVVSNQKLSQEEIARSLYFAKKSMRNEAKQDFHHPYHWAAFCLTALHAEKN